MMAYPITIAARTISGVELNTVILPHAPEDAEKVIAIRTSLLRGETFRRRVILAAAAMQAEIVSDRL